MRNFINVRAIALPLSIAVTLGLPACGGNEAGGADVSQEAEAFDLVQDSTITVAVSGTPPSFVVSPTGDVTGVVPTIIEAFAEEHGLEVKYDQYSFAASLAAVQGGRADLGGAAYYTEERAENLLFLRPIMKSGSWLVFPEGAEYSEPDDLMGERIGVASGYAQVPYLQEFSGASKVDEYTSDSSGIQAIKTGRNAAYVSGGDVIPYAEEDKSLQIVQMETGDFGMPAEITESSSNMFVRCGKEDLADSLNEFLAEFVERDDFEDLIDEYSVPEIAITDGEPFPNTCG